VATIDEHSRIAALAALLPNGVCAMHARDTRSSALRTASSTRLAAVRAQNKLARCGEHRPRLHRPPRHISRNLMPPAPARLRRTLVLPHRLRRQPIARICQAQRDGATLSV
jgi:hypothetical protein